MYISEYDFEKISTHKKPCVVYGESGNDVREVAKDLYPMEIVMNCTKLMGFYIEVIENDDNYIEYRSGVIWVIAVLISYTSINIMFFLMI